MNRLNYNISMGVAHCSITAGTALLWGTGVALIVAGVTIIALTLLSMKVSS